jgi:hypothetical protein
MLFLYLIGLEGKRQVWKTRRRWEDNIKIKHKETRCEGVDYINLAQDNVQWRDLANTVMNLRIPKEAVKFLTS